MIFSVSEKLGKEAIGQATIDKTKVTVPVHTRRHLVTPTHIGAKTILENFSICLTYVVSLICPIKVFFLFSPAGEARSAVKKRAFANALHRGPENCRAGRTSRSTAGRH